MLTSHISVLCQTDTRYLVNSEGSRVAHGRGFARVVINAGAKAADGTDVSSFETFEAVDETGLPDDKVILAAIDRVANDVSKLLKAPEAEPFVGPAIFSGRAAGVFFHEIFGHRVEGHRQKDESEGQSSTKSVGTKVLPDFLSVIFDPTLRKVGGVDLNGWYDYDDEGVKARSITAVDKGVLKTFLMSRSPIKGFGQSNGHGRRQPGLEVVSRQSNLLVESTNAVSDARLRQMLLAEVKKQNKPYGLYFRDITGGFTTTQRSGLQAFKVIPVIVYRVYPDGRPDELVRGADIVGTPLSSFSKILATSDKQEVFNGYCGAESGSVPVSAVASRHPGVGSKSPRRPRPTTGRRCSRTHHHGKQPRRCKMSRLPFSARTKRGRTISCAPVGNRRPAACLAVLCALGTLGMLCGQRRPLRRPRFSSDAR